MITYPTDDELRELAKARDAVRKSGIRLWSRVSPRLMGLYGERAAARFLGVPMNTDVRQSRGDRRSNLITPNGVHVDVITRSPLGRGKLPDIALPITGQEKPRTDLALLLAVFSGEDREVFLAGWVWETELRAKGREATFRDGPNIVAYKRQWRPVHDLLKAQLRPGLDQSTQETLWQHQETI